MILIAARLLQTLALWACCRGRARCAGTRAIRTAAYVAARVGGLLSPPSLRSMPSCGVVGAEGGAWWCFLSLSAWQASTRRAVTRSSGSSARSARWDAEALRSSGPTAAADADWVCVPACWCLCVVSWMWSGLRTDQLPGMQPHWPDAGAEGRTMRPQALPSCLRLNLLLADGAACPWSPASTRSGPLH